MIRLYVFLYSVYRNRYFYFTDGFGCTVCCQYLRSLGCSADREDVFDTSVKYFKTYDDGPWFFMLLRYTWDRNVLMQLPAACAGRITPEQLERINRGNLFLQLVYRGGPGSMSQCCRLNTAVF